MAFNYVSQKGSVSAVKHRLESDVQVFTVNDGYGHAVTSTMPSLTAFAANPVRSATGVWSVTMKDVVPTLEGQLHFVVTTILASGNYLSVQMLPFTTNATTGQLVVNWVFNVAGTPTDLPSSGSPQFEIRGEWSLGG